MAYSERELIARMIQCEAGGEGDNGMMCIITLQIGHYRVTG